jgi:CubicO group peptidase (beta-lactamase class C family)
MTVPFSAGGLYSTVEDLYKWDQALYTEKLVSKKSLDAMFTPYRNNYGFGFVISRLYDRKFISHSGSIEGFATYIARYPDDRVTIIVLNNVGGSQPPVGRMAINLAAILFGNN